MAAHKENIPVDREAEQRNISLTAEYSQKLILAHDVVLPDPFSLKQGWLAETKGTGLSKWPSVYITDIVRFLTQVNATTELLFRLECKYKEGRAYCYFKCEWVKEIYYHNISDTSEYCFLKGRFTPSQNITNQAYYVWATVEKDGQKPGGKIESAYCTCTAGLLGCCNHAVALLFRVEAAVRTGATKPSSTSVLAKWNVPTGTKRKLVHKPITEMNIHRFHYRGDNSVKEKLQSATEKYDSFEFLSPQKTALLRDKAAMRNLLYEKLKTVASDSCFIELMGGTRKTQKRK